MRITFVVSSLTKGGAERIVVSLANGLNDLGHRVSVVTKTVEGKPDYRLASGIIHREITDVIHGVGPLQRLRGVRERGKILRSTLLETEPDLVVSFTTELNVRVLGALLRSDDVPVIVSERNNPRVAETKKKWRLLRRLRYRRAACLVSLSHGVDSCFSWLPDGKRAVIHNPLPSNTAELLESQPELTLDPSFFWFVATGRLVQQKGFDLLLRVFAEVHRKASDTRLLILGEGPERESLENQCNELGIRDAVLMPGRIHNPFAVYRQAHCFVLSSRYEGFGNVLIESMAAGLPPVSFDCQYGPSEIINCPGDNGILVSPEDIESFIFELLSLYSDNDRRKRIAGAAQERSRDFQAGGILSEWQTLLQRVDTSTGS